MKLEFKLNTDNLTKALRERPIQTTNKIINLLNTVADTFEETAQNAAPRGETGALRDSIYSKVDTVGLSVELGSDSSMAHYNSYVEYGTRFMDAQPYFRPTRAKCLRKLQDGLDTIT